MNALTSILIASRQIEDQQRIITALPEDDFLIIGTEKDESGTIIRTERLKPDVLILDLQMPLTNYTELMQIIRRRSPSTAIIVFAKKESDNIAGFLQKTGISGFLFEEDINKLAPIIKIVNLGGYYISASILTKIIDDAVLISQFPWQISKNDAALFSPVERGIVTDLANGLSDNQIAKHLNYSEGSIKNILSFLRRRTNMKSRAQLVVFALISGLINFENLWMYKKQ